MSGLISEISMMYMEKLKTNNDNFLLHINELQLKACYTKDVVVIMYMNCHKHTK